MRKLTREGVSLALWECQKTCCEVSVVFEKIQEPIRSFAVFWELVLLKRIEFTSHDVPFLLLGGG